MATFENKTTLDPTDFANYCSILNLPFLVKVTETAAEQLQDFLDGTSVLSVHLLLPLEMVGWSFKDLSHFSMDEDRRYHWIEYIHESSINMWCASGSYPLPDII